MESLGTIEIRVEGIRGSGQVSPANYDIADLRETLDRVESLLLPVGGRRRPTITYEMEEGSVRHIFRTSMQYAVMLGAVLGQIHAADSLDFLESGTAKAIEDFQSEAIKRDWTFTIVTSAAPESPLTISRSTHYVRDQKLKTEATFYLYGKVTTLGGKNKGTIHIDTEEYGNLTVETPQAELQNLEGNLLYHVTGVEAIGLQNPYTGEIDRSSLRFRQFIAYEPEYDDSYLRRLIEKARRSWSDVPDVDDWLRDIRGYAGA